ncbi:helix-turn-helix domain-containing protein [Tellurirhabdus rosea]|uniref:helix-turn-helix domain-containing protein n=1 Tax=Tellurirhabdus rosea TaxID=2674997 RepID=UPI00225245C3|nr:AraC family transcriptional regulator [Tellurirhabdus rosea]
MKLGVKHMVCDRCKRVVREELEKLGLDVQQVDLGEVTVAGEPDESQLVAVRQILEANGFELLDDRRSVLVEQIKRVIINEIHHDRRDRPEHQNLSDYLAQKLGYDYSYLSHLFSSVEAMTIEKYVIAQKIEKVKEYLAYNELSLSEIAWRLGYSSSQHLSNQFRQVVGMTPGAFRKEGLPLRRSLDAVNTPK